MVNNSEGMFSNSTDKTLKRVHNQIVCRPENGKTEMSVIRKARATAKSIQFIQLTSFRKAKILNYIWATSIYL